MGLKIYNTLTKKIEKFTPVDKEEVKIYTCGPTVYDFAHIGNLRSYIFEDILEKVLVFNGYKVNRVMNITDVGHMTSDSDTGEDKMLKGAKRENKSILELAEFYTKAFFSDTKKLNIKTPNTVKKASDHIEEYIDMIKVLIKKEVAYLANGNVYFDITKSDNYYELSGKQKDDLIVGARQDVEEDGFKKNTGDFGLWFTNSKFVDQDLKWDSPWGIGYPGWHIECSGLAIKYLGNHLDIHCGGVDNIFPHHSNEIAQSEAYLGHKWCNYWVHGEHLNDKSGKMSKSEGKTLTVSLLEEKGYNPLSYRFFCLLSHYRKQLMFTYEGLENTQSAYNKLLSRIKKIKQSNTGAFIKEDYDKYIRLFKTAVNNDLNTANSITILYDVLKAKTTNKTKVKIIESIDEVLSLDLLKEKTIDNDLKKYIEEKIKERHIAKANKDYKLADSIRDELLEKNIIIKDTKEATTYSINK